jgi:hypothetical protein
MRGHMIAARRESSSSQCNCGEGLTSLLVKTKHAARFLVARVCAVQYAAASGPRTGLTAWLGATQQLISSYGTTRTHCAEVWNPLNHTTRHKDYRVLFHRIAPAAKWRALNGGFRFPDRLRRERTLLKWRRLTWSECNSNKLH